MSKTAELSGTIIRNAELPADEMASEKLGTVDDQRDMLRMGKSQSLRRNFGFFSIFGFSMILMSTWEATLGLAAFGLMNGGTAGMIYTYIGGVIGFTAVIASMAEMASMAPTAGGQYHWVSEFAPRSLQKFLSYVVGWLCVLGWQTGCALSAFLAGTEIQGLIVLNHPGYVFQRWHGTMLTIAVVVACGIFNTFLARKLPLVEGIVLGLHLAGFFAILVPLWVLGPRSPSAAVFTEFADVGGWGSVGLACLVGILTPTVALIGPDSVVHMSEELRDASKTLPKAMMFTLVINGSLGFVMLVTLCYTIGDVERVLSTPTGFPFIQVFHDATQSVGGATAMTSIMIVLSTFCCVTNVATAARQLFAFARDRAVPFSGFFSYVPPGWDIPLNAISLTLFFVVCLALINIGSTVAFNQINSLGVCALLASYMTSISCVTVKRVRGEPLLPRRFSLGRYGLLVNAFSVLFLLLAFAFCFFPPSPRGLAPATMNWSVFMFGAVVLGSLGYYAAWARHVYVGPVEYVRKDV